MTDSLLAWAMSQIEADASQANVEGMARFGIGGTNVKGVSVKRLREIAKETGSDHGLALELWNTEVHEARILASIVDDPAQVTEAQMDAWVADFDSWDLCDQCCQNLFAKTPFAVDKARQWSRRSEQFVKRAGLVLIAQLAVHNRAPSNDDLRGLAEVAAEAATDDRNFVKKAASWALRQAGKRNVELHGAAIEMAQRLSLSEARSARWVASDVLRELQSEKVLRRLADE